MTERAPSTTRPGRLADRPVVALTLAQAFVDDPAMAYLFPKPLERPQRIAAFFDLITRSEADPALTDIVETQDGVVAAAIWRPPGAWATPTTTMLRHGLRLLRTFGTGLPRALRVQALLEAHHPPAPHWYLEYVGCVPAAQGKGHGGAAIHARLARCDDERLPAALETATAANVPIYRALGFVITSEFDVPNGPHFWTMWREPRQTSP